MKPNDRFRPDTPASPVLGDEEREQLKARIEKLERLDPVVEEGGSTVTRAQGQGYAYAAMEPADDGEYVERAAVLSVLALAQGEERDA